MMPHQLASCDPAPTHGRGPLRLSVLLPAQLASKRADGPYHGHSLELSLYAHQLGLKARWLVG